MGMSLGSIPTIHISTIDYYNNLRGIILICPISAGLKLVNPNIRTVEDNNYDFGKISEISSPILIIHGKQDDVIPFQRSQELIDKMRNIFVWFPSKANHSNILSKYRYKFYLKIKFFLDHLDYLNRKKENNITASTDYSKISMKLKNVVTEPNYINGSQFKNIQSPIKMSILEEETKNCKSTSFRENCISVKKEIIIIDNSDCPFGIRPSVEIEGEYIFNDQYEVNYYNSQDAKDLEDEFRKIEKM